MNVCAISEKIATRLWQDGPNSAGQMRLIDGCGRVSCEFRTDMPRGSLTSERWLSGSDRVIQADATGG